MADVIIGIMSSGNTIYDAIKDQIDQLRPQDAQLTLDEDAFVFISLATPSESPSGPITLAPPVGMGPPTREEKIDKALGLIAASIAMSAPFAIQEGGIDKALGLIEASIAMSAPFAIQEGEIEKLALLANGLQYRSL